MAVSINENCVSYKRSVYTPSKTAQDFYNYLQWTGDFICAKDFYIKREGLLSFLLLKTKSGIGNLILNGENFALTSETFLLLDCSQPHIYFPKTENWEFRFLHFFGKEIEGLYKHIIALNGGHIFKSTPKIERCISDCLSFEDCDETLTKEARISQSISNLLYEIIHSIKEDEGMQKVCRYIEENCCTALSAGAVAEKFGFSRSYFSTEFKKEAGTTLSDYILTSRINLAKLLLCENSLSVSQIAERVGFGDTGTFIRAFKRKEKITPLQFKQSGY